MGSKIGSVRSLRRHIFTEAGRPISQQQFSDLLGVTWGTVSRWERNGCRSERFVRKLARLEKVLFTLGDQVRPEHRVAFLIQRHPLLLNLRPIDLLETDDGLVAVLRQLEGG